MTARRPRRLDAVGLALAGATIAWTLVSAALNDGSRPWPTVGAILLAVLGVAAGRVVAARRSSGSARLGTGVLIGLLVGLLVGFGGGEAGGAPLGYANANAALFVGVALAAVLLRVSAPAMPKADRLAVTIVGAGAVVACLSTRSVGTTVGLVAGLAIAAVAATLRRPWVAVSLAAVVLSLALGVTAAVVNGAAVDAPGDDGLGTRVQLWRSAIELARDEPIIGVGPGRFADVAPLAADPDLRRAHSTPFEVLAEQGAPGLVLHLALVGWALAALWAAGLRPESAVGGATLVAFGVQACWDWVLAEPAVLLFAALLVGWSSSRRSQPQASFFRRATSA